MTIIAAADGSSLGNPGPTGWGWYIDDHRWAAGGQAQGTNNIGELSAVIDLLEQTAGVDDLLVLCDSQYVIKAITQWMPGWKRKGWKKADGKPVMNVELMQRLDRLMDERTAAGATVRFEWVKGHAGHPLNEAADRLANGAAVAFQRGAAPEPGPGFGGGAATGVSTSAAPDASSAPAVAEGQLADRDDPVAGGAVPTLFDDELEASPTEEKFAPAHDLRLTIWRDARTGEVINHQLEQLGGEGWLRVG